MDTCLRPPRPVTSQEHSSLSKTCLNLLDWLKTQTLVSLNKTIIKSQNNNNHLFTEIHQA